MKEIDDFFDEQNRKNIEGILTVGEAIAGYYRLLEGPQAGRVIIITHCARIDDKSIVFYANGLVWTYLEKIKDMRCERVGVTFSEGYQKVDRSQATWYPDNSDNPEYYHW